ncbi:tyrosine/phenylalanine carboxypeptidase domain-containing protein [Patescibacteria group bacterium]
METSKTNPESIIPRSEQALDERWFAKFKDVSIFQAYEYYVGDPEERAEQKEAFINNEVDNPTLDYPKLDLESLQEHEGYLVEFKKDLLLNEANENIRQIYRWKVNEKIAENRMMQASVNGDMRHFERYSKFVYGEPSPEIFAGVINMIREQAQSNLGSSNKELDEISQRVLAQLPDFPEAKTIALPSQKAIDSAYGKTILELGDLVQISEEQEEYDAKEMKEIFQAALNNIEVNDWNVVVSEQNKATMSVDQESKQVLIPKNKKVTFEKLKGLLAHEIGTHIVRRKKGERSRLKLLSLGLDRYEKGEEGLSTMAEQALSGNMQDYAGIVGHLSIGLAKGIGGKPKDFRQLFNVMTDIYTMNRLAEGKNLEKAQDLARKRAWNNCVRVFRGTDCKTPGVVFTKDIIYREGNIGVWDVLGKNPEEQMRFTVGKYDPANPRHILMLEQLGINDAELSELEEK